MRRYHRWILLLALLLSSSALAQKPADQRRLLRIEGRVYGWYGVAEPAFDQTIGRRELFKINAGERFLKGLEGRLVILQGQFSNGQLDLGELAPPPVSVPEGSRRQRFTITRVDGDLLETSDGYRLRTDDPTLRVEDLAADLVIAPLSGEQWQVVGVLSAVPGAVQQESPRTAAAAAALTPAPLHSSPLEPGRPLSGGALLELELTQALLDAVVDLGREQAGMKAGLQGLNLALSQLRIILPDGMSSEQTPWRLEGTVELSYSALGTLAESSFVISARPVIAQNILYLEPNWQEIKLEGQLPFGFSLDANRLGQLQAFLPQRLTVLNLEWVSSALRAQGLLSADEAADWFLGGGNSGTVRLGLGPAGASISPSTRGLAPGNFRLQLSAPVADRLVRRAVESMLDPERPYLPDPPITVGKVLFVSIKVDQVFLRSLRSGYSQGVFRFQDLVVDVGWKAGPLNGLEPLLSASGFLRPRLTAPGPDGVRFWDWDTRIENLLIRSDKLPGNKQELAAELIPRLERELGSQLAQQKKVPARLPLSVLTPTSGAAANAAIEVTELRPLDALLELEGRLLR